MNNQDIWQIAQTVDLARGAQAPQVWPNALMLCGDSNAHIWRVSVMNGGQPAKVAGKVTGYFIRADGATVAVTGSLAGNVASVVLPQSCYTIEGDLQAVMRVALADGGGVMPLSALILHVRRMLTDSVVDNERVIPSLEDLLAQIERMERGTQAAATAAVAANTAASNANAKTQAADTAARSATEAAGAANAAASNADAKAQAADTAAASATEAAVAANAAASNADAKAQAASTAAASATEAAGAANTAAAVADSKAQEADTAAASATAAAGEADAAASNATSKASAANEAAQAANAAAAKLDGLTVSAAGLAEGAAPTADVSDVDGHKHIALGIPQGAKGDTGATPKLSIGTVTTCAPGAQASAALTGPAEAPVLSLTIPQGRPGTGNVSSVCGVEPDAAGNVPLGAADVGAYAAGNLRTAPFNLPVSVWTGNGPYTATISREDVTTNTWVHLALDAASVSNYPAAIEWSTDTPGQIVLSTAVQPTGALNGHLVLMEVVE